MPESFQRKGIMQLRDRVFVIFAMSVLVLNGCSIIHNVTAPRGKMPQNEEMDYSNPLKLKIEKCYWANTVNRADDFSGFGSRLPDMSVKAQDSFLVVEIALTNYGNQPLTPQSPPVFELKSASGTTYQSDARFQGMNQINSLGTLAGSNINPGRAAKGRLVFDVPKGSYELYVNASEWRGAAFYRSELLWIWELSPSDEK